MPDPVNQTPLAPVDGVPRARRWRFPLPWRPRCLGCGDRVTGALDLCGDCAARLPWNAHRCPACALPLPEGVPALPCAACRRAPPPVTATVAPLLYAAPIDRWQPRFKFHHDLAAGRLLSQLLAEACAQASRPQALVPIPLHPERLRSRGYDQALELAKPMARALSLRLRTDLLQRVRATTPQSSLDAGGCRRNLEGAFVLVPAGDKDALPAHVALVDDVITTGATLHAAARALLAAGVARVDAWACARVPQAAPRGQPSALW